MVASSEYDQVILEDRRTNRVVESRAIFETIVNNKSFVNVSIILFMNKSDLLEGKFLYEKKIFFIKFIFFFRKSSKIRYSTIFY